MNRFSLASLVSVFAGAVVTFSPLAARAQTARADGFTAEQLRAQYVAHGYQADAPVTWWIPNHVTSFRVSDLATGRVVMILVYRDVATADLDRSKAEAHDDATAGNGPHLIPGYGYSTWRENVALVESTTDDLARQFTAEQAADNQIMTGAPVAVETGNAMPTYAVDLDIINVIDGETVNL
jgi:hypothetical protein